MKFCCLNLYLILATGNGFERDRTIHQSDTQHIVMRFYRYWKSQEKRDSEKKVVELLYPVVDIEYTRNYFFIYYEPCINLPQAQCCYFLAISSSNCSYFVVIDRVFRRL